MTPVTDNITGRVASFLERDLRNIYSAQQLIARRNIYVSGRDLKTVKRKGDRIGYRTGRLMASLDSPSYTITGSGEHFQVTASICQHMRFLDMRHLGNRRIYNRQVWGILYNNSYKDLRYGLSRDIQDRLGQQLRKAFSEHK